MELLGKKVLVVCGGFRLYGAEAATVTLMRALGKAGAAVTCFTSEWSDGEFERTLKEGGLRYRTAKWGWFYLRKPHWTFESLRHYPAALARFGAVLREFMPDYVVHASYRSVAVFYPLLNRNNYLFVQDKISGDRQGAALLPWLDSKIRRYLACSAFISRDLARLRIGGEKIAVLPNCTNVQTHRCPNAGGEILHIGIVGQIVAKKGHETLLRALGELRRRRRRFVLSIFGSGESAFVERLKSLAIEEGVADVVRFEGFVSDKGAIYRELDLVVVPTLSDEPFGLAALEPAACGIPVIASNKGGLPEVVDHERTGFLFPAGDWIALARLIERAIDSPEEFAVLGANGQRRARELFSEEAMLARLRAI